MKPSRVQAGGLSKVCLGFALEVSRRESYSSRLKRRLTFKARPFPLVLASDALLRRQCRRCHRHSCCQHQPVCVPLFSMQSDCTTSSWVLRSLAGAQNPKNGTIDQTMTAAGGSRRLPLPLRWAALLGLVLAARYPVQWLRSGVSSIPIGTTLSAPPVPLVGIEQWAAAGPGAAMAYRTPHSRCTVLPDGEQCMSPNRGWYIGVLAGLELTLVLVS